MRPIPIPDDWVPDGFTRRTLASPTGDPTGVPLEVILDEEGNLSSYWIPDKSDMIDFPGLVIILTCQGVQPPVSLVAFNNKEPE